MRNKSYRMLLFVRLPRWFYLAALRFFFAPFWVSLGLDSFVEWPYKFYSATGDIWNTIRMIVYSWPHISGYIRSNWYIIWIGQILFEIDLLLDWMQTCMIGGMNKWLGASLLNWPTDWLNDWSSDWKTNRRTSWDTDKRNDELTSWPTDEQTNWLTTCLSGHLTDWQPDWLHEGMTDWRTDRLTDWGEGEMTDELTDWRDEWLTDWLINWNT